MYNEEQMVQLSLLKEIDCLCRKHNIEYYLSPNLTLCAVKGKAFYENPLYGEVLMKVEDMERFRQIVQDDPGEGRALESMKTHKWFPGFYLRYENTNTLYVNLETSRNYANLCMGVNIRPIRRKYSSRLKAKMWTVWEMGWLRRCGVPSVRGKSEYRIRLAGVVMRAICFTGQAGFAKRLYDKFCRDQEKEKSGRYVIRQGAQLVSYPEDIFGSSVRINLGEEEFSVPKNTAKYLKISLGEKYLEKKEKPYKQPGNAVFSARVGGDCLLEKADRLDNYYRERNVMRKKNKKTADLGNYLDECWKYAGFCVKRMNLGASYKKREGYIKNLYKNEDYLRLESEFKSYEKVMNQSLKKGEVFAEDEEIFNIYMDVISKTGKMVQKSRIEKLI